MKIGLILSAAVAVFSVTGCCDEWGDDAPRSGSWDWGGERPGEWEEPCSDYCDHLIACDLISNSSRSVCMDLCEPHYYDDESRAIVGSHCASTATCEIEEIEACGFNPVPLSSEEGGESGFSSMGGAPAQGGGESSGGSDAALSCSRNHDCDADADCIDGACLARCAASCQCVEGMACEGGYCRAPEEPADECETNCDCTSGQRCMTGRCE